MVTAREVASRAGLALDNARLYHQQQAFAEGLQRSLLTDPPETEGLQIAMRYQPAAQAAAVVAELERPTPEGEATRLRWSNAGHPPPIVIAPEGEVSVLAGHEADLLLGLDPATPRATTVLDLSPGTTVLLHTDGLVERRGQSIDEGLTALHETLVDLTGEGVSLDELCDACLRRLLPPDAEDDAALVAVRLN